MPQFSEADLTYMRRALQLAERARGHTSPNPMVGAVFVKDGKVIGEGFHKQAGKPHAEIEAIRSAKADLAGSTLYVTLEPCSHTGKTPPCVNTLIEHKIARVVIPVSDPDRRVAGRGIAMLQQAGVQVDIGLCEAEALRQNEFFINYHARLRPFLICKWAMTLDGRIATESGHSRWISNEESRRYVHQIRAQVDAVMVGIGTVLLDNPMLNVRLENEEIHQPKKIVIDGSLRIPLKAKCLEHPTPGSVIIATTQNASSDKIKQLRALGHTVLVLMGRRALIDMKELIRELYLLEIQSILCEGGSSLFGSLLQAHLVDKVIAFIAPKIVGGETAKPPVTGWGVDLMHKALRLEDLTFRNFGEDVCVEGYMAAGSRSGKPYPRKTPAASKS